MPKELVTEFVSGFAGLLFLACLFTPVALAAYLAFKWDRIWATIKYSRLFNIRAVKSLSHRLESLKYRNFVFDSFAKLSYPGGGVGFGVLWKDPKTKAELFSDAYIDTNGSQRGSYLGGGPLPLTPAKSYVLCLLREAWDKTNAMMIERVAPEVAAKI